MRTGMVLRVAGALALIVVAACTERALRPVPYAVRVIPDVIYTPSGWPQPLHADLWVPKTVGPFPAVVLLHGGRWDGGSRKDMDDIAQALAERGFLAMTVDYRLAPRWTYPAPLDDARQAVRWLRDNAGLYEIAPERIGAWGYSAGGYLAAMLAVAVPEHDPSARIAAAVAGAAPTDLRPLAQDETVSRFLGKPIAADPALYARASPITHVTAAAAPLFLYHGDWDRVVDIAQPRAMKQALDAAGVPAELYELGALSHTTTKFFAPGAVEEGTRFLGRYLKNR